MKPEQRKKLILDSAKKLFSRGGYYQTQISDIIRDAGIARGTIYQYFSNKEDIFITLLEQNYSRWENSVSLAAADIDLSIILPLDYFRHRIKKTLLFFAKDKDLCNIALRVGPGLPGGMATVIRRFEMRVNKLLTADLELGINNGHVRKNLNIELTVNLLVGALFSTAYHYFSLESEPEFPIEIDRATEEIVALFAPGMFLGKYEPPKAEG